MSRLLTIARILAAITTLSLLSACTLGQAPAPTATPVDVNAVYTQAAATAFAQLTEMASLVTPTLPPTETPTQAATATSATAATSAATAVIELSPTQNVIIQITVEATTPAAANGSPTLPGLPGFTPMPSVTPIPTLAPVIGGGTGPICKNSSFQGDVTIPDGTAFKAWEKFTKIWAIKNTGICDWDEGFAFKMYAGDNMGGNNYVIQNESQFVKAGEVVNMGIKMFAPGEPRDYISHWSMFDDQGKAFGSDFVVYIKVVKK